MTISNTTNRVQYNGDGSTIEFPFVFGIFAEDDLDIILTSSTGVDTTLTRGVDYDVTLTTPTDLPSAGLVTFIGTPTPTPPALGEKLTVIRILDFTQEIDIQDGGPLPASSVNEAFDRAVCLLQQIKEIINRSVQLPVSSSVTNISLPPPEAGYFLRWNDSEDALENQDISAQGDLAVSAFGKTLIDDTDAAAARATLGLGTIATEDAPTVVRWA